MSTFVSVESFEALKHLRTALCLFGQAAGAGLDEADAELQRTSHWLRLEQTAYWKKEAATRAELLARAKSALERKKMQTTALGGRPSCDEELKELARATRRMEEAKQKIANVKRWSRRLEEEMLSYQAVAGGLSQALTSDIPNALAQLDNMLIALEAYAPVAAPQMQASQAAPAGTAGLPGGAEIESMARAAPATPFAGDYRALRARTPAPAQRETLPVRAASAAGPAGVGPAPTWAADLAQVGLPREPVAPGDRIVIARGAAAQARVYFERLTSVGPGDSGWFFGTVDPEAAPEYEALQVSDFVAARPEFAPLLELTAGCLVVLDSGRLAAVLDAADNPCWPPAPQAATDPAGEPERQVERP